MFASFFNMLYPSKTFLTSVLNILHYNPSTYDIEELNNQMSSKEECELLNGSVDVSEINKNLSLKNFFIQNILIKKTKFIFKRNFSMEKTKLFFDNIIVDIYQKNQEENNIIIKEEENKEEKKGSGGFLNNVINVVIHNLEVGLKNITLKFYDKENKNVDYVLYIKYLEFKEAKDVKQIQQIEKGKFLFIHNKALYLGKIIFKEKWNKEDEEIFEKEEEIDQSLNLIKSENCICYLGNEIELDFFHDKDNLILTLANINTSKFFMENIIYKEQLNKLYSYFIKNEKKEEDVKEIININVEQKNKEDKDYIDLMGFKLKKINLEIKVDLLYFILLEENKNENIKEKKWISFDKNIIKEEELNNGIDTMNLIIKYNNIYKSKYYLFCLNNLLFKFNKRIAYIDNISLNLIDPENLDKNDEINIENSIQNNENLIKSKNYMQVTKLNFDFEQKKFTYDKIYLEINNKIISLAKFIINNFTKNNKPNNINNNVNIQSIENNKENNIIEKEENIININNIKEENKEKKIFKIIGQNLNIKMLIDKNIEKYVDKISLNDIFNEDNNYDFINLLIDNINMNNDENKSIFYDKFELAFNNIEDNKEYPIIKPVDTLKTSRIKTEQNGEIKLYLDFDLYIFCNPKIIKPILNYCKKVSKLFQNKQQVVINNVNEIHNNINDKISNDLNLNINLNSIKIVLTENQDAHEAILNNNINNIKDELPINEIIINENENNYICFNFNKIKIKLEENKEFIKYKFIMKSLIIQDHISSSKYKILLSNYDFKNEEEILIDVDINITFNNNINKFEIKPKIKISPFAIYLDQMSLFYIYYFLDQIKEDEQNEINNDNINFINNEQLNINDNNGKYIISNIDINKFFLLLNYSTNNAAKEYNSKNNNKLSSLFNTTSINNLKIIFQNYSTEENIKLTPKDCVKKLYEFYSTDMLKQISGSFISTLPLFYHIYEAIDGSLDIVREPLDKYEKNESIADGLVKGVGTWAIKTATLFTYLGESIGNIFSFKGCTCKNDSDINLDNKEYSYCRQLRHMFNEENKEMEEYYLK